MSTPQLSFVQRPNLSPTLAPASDSANPSISTDLLGRICEQLINSGAEWVAPSFAILKGRPGVHTPWVETRIDLCFHGMPKGFCSACVPPVLPPKTKSAHSARINPLHKAADFVAVKYSADGEDKISTWPPVWYRRGKRVLSTIPAPAACPHGLLAVTDKNYSRICHGCHYGYPAWETTRKPLNIEQFSRVETISYSPRGRDRSLGALGCYSGPANSDTKAAKKIVWDDVWSGSHPTVFFQRGRVIQVPSGPLELWMERWIANSLRPTSTINWGDPASLIAERKFITAEDWYRLPFIEDYLQWLGARPYLTGIVTTTEALQLTAAIHFRRQPPIRFGIRRNWCPNCVEYLPMSHDSDHGVGCKEYQEQRKRQAEKEAAKQCISVAEFFARYNTKREKQLTRERALNQVAWLLGDEWAATHPQMGVDYIKPRGKNPERLSYCDPEGLLNILHGKAASESIGGRRINTSSWTHEKDAEDEESDFNSPSKDRNARDYRAYLMNKTKRPEQHVSHTIRGCERQGCENIVTKRKGARFCSDVCQERDWKERNAA